MTIKHPASVAVSCGGHLWPSAASAVICGICGHLRRSAAICGHLRPSAAICGYLRPSAAICGYLRPSAA
jgi:hypothetical protein